MKNSGMLKFALIASLILNVTFLATAGYVTYRQNAVWTSPFGGSMPRDRFLFEDLSLKPEQLKALKKRTIPFREEIDRRRQEIVEKRRELIILMRADRPDREKIDAVIAAIGKMQEEMQRRITSHMLEVKASLEPDQQRKFVDLIENRMTAAGPPGCPPEHGQ